MKATPATVHPGKPKSAPRVTRPVYVDLDSRVYYVGSGGLDETRSLYCSDSFARLVLTPLDAWAQRHGFGVLHLGCYAPREARRADGRPIKPPRWSNHSYGCGLDFAGILVDGHVMRIPAMKAGCPAKLEELLHAVRASITGAHRMPEIVDEGMWVHIGIYP